MCGISVCVAKTGIVDKIKFDAMTDIISHRGPDDRGVYYNNKIAMGHRRLSIIDLTRDGHQPFEMIDGFVLVFNGEIYNYIEIKNELIKKGYIFKTKTDTEIIINAYIEWGSSCVNHFNGMWAFVLYDIENELLFCSRDRYGVKPLYYFNDNKLFLIGSEIKQLFEMVDNRPKANKEALLKYIVRGETCAPPYTFFQNIFQLEPGHNIVFNIKDDSFEKSKYYDINNTTENKSIEYEKACEKFKSLFFESVRLRLRSDVPVGYFLSGGLDSSSIVCAADQLQKKNGICKAQHTISSCYKDKRYDEQEYIDYVVNKTNVQVHKVFPAEDEMWKKIDKIIWHMDEPVFSASGFSQWSVCEEAKEQGLKVILDGQGADEQLAGYSDFYNVFFIELIKKKKIKRLIHEISGYKKNGNNKEPIIFLLSSSIKDILTSESYDKKIKRFYYKYLVDLPFEKNFIKRIFKDIDVYPKRDARKYIKTYMTDELMNILQNLDRKTMAFSIEARNPFLDYRLVDYLYSTPFLYKIRNGWTKAILRDSMSSVIPKEIERRRTKLAFVAPIEKWINDNKSFYREELEKTINNFDSIFDIKKILNWYDRKSYLKTSECNLIWRIIISGRWISIFNVKL